MQLLKREKIKSIYILEQDIKISKNKDIKLIT